MTTTISSVDYAVYAVMQLMSYTVACSMYSSAPTAQLTAVVYSSTVVYTELLHDSIYCIVLQYTVLLHDCIYCIVHQLIRLFKFSAFFSFRVIFMVVDNCGIPVKALTLVLSMSGWPRRSSWTLDSAIWKGQLYPLYW